MVIYDIVKVLIFITLNVLDIYLFILDMKILKVKKITGNNKVLIWGCFALLIFTYLSYLIILADVIINKNYEYFKFAMKLLIGSSSALMCIKVLGEQIKKSDEY